MTGAVTLDDLARFLGLIPSIADRLARIDERLDRLAAATPAPAEPALLTIAQAARVAGVSSCTMRRWEQSGLVRSVRHGHTIRICADSLKPTDRSTVSRLAREARGL